MLIIYTYIIYIYNIRDIYTGSFRKICIVPLICMNVASGILLTTFNGILVLCRRPYTSRPDDWKEAGKILRKNRPSSLVWYETHIW